MKHTYIDSKQKNAVKQFSNAFHLCLNEKLTKCSEIVFLCIGTDRATGDCLGPLTGDKIFSMLSTGEKNKFSGSTEKEIKVYGTLDRPVHAKNLIDTIKKIYLCNKNPLVVAIDASLGKAEHVGFLSLGSGGIKPGAGLNKNLPEIGDIFITGIVNFTSGSDFYILQNTRLNHVMKMANIIYDGILCALFKTNETKTLSEEPLLNLLEYN